MQEALKWAQQTWKSPCQKIMFGKHAGLAALAFFESEPSHSRDPCNKGSQDGCNNKRNTWHKNISHSSRGAQTKPHF
ncbi:hypothetical protein O181_067001 [Austropuccinia psidii MF-1]|uniref:Uncharacterized protein n=1 Tax=Austropuccinia psidii MF-1 TaxID=1389203 RepID=A0A9Q3EYR4_9BASI|nr:hypothetical protein [Austropuccinia psidii MF-1]